MAGMIRDLIVSPAGTSTLVDLPAAARVVDESTGVDFGRVKAPLTDGAFIGGESDGVTNLTLEFAIEGDTPQAQELSLATLRDAFFAKAAGRRCQVFLYYDRDAGFGIGFDDCIIDQDGFEVRRLSYVDTPAGHITRAWPVRVKLIAQTRLNWTAYYLGKVDSGETTYNPAGAASTVTFTSLVLDGGDFIIKDQASGDIGVKWTAAGDMYLAGSLIYVPTTIS